MAYHHLSRKERGKIALLANQHKSIREIAAQLGRSPATISRELTRNTSEHYRADYAERQYQLRRQRCHRKPLYSDQSIASYVTLKLLMLWSPEQIAGRMKLEKMDFTVSFASIYRWLSEGLLPRAIELKQALRRYKKRKKSEPRASRMDAKTIHQRAKDVLRRHRYGDWEVDTISFYAFPNQTYILNATERKSKYCALVLLSNIKREEVLRAFRLHFSDGRLPLKSMTSDRGMEFNCHNEFESEFQVPYYYADRGKPYQKPTVENLNGLLRQYLPRGTKIQELPPGCIDEIMAALNNRPRKSLGFRTPNEVLHLT